METITKLHLCTVVPAREKELAREATSRQIRGAPVATCNPGLRSTPYCPLFDSLQKNQSPKQIPISRAVWTLSLSRSTCFRRQIASAMGTEVIVGDFQATM